tara:strand:+ start:2053 stop:2544 length:492 start_codon:yes stop_codon:yes gene_type:complete
MLKPLFKHKKAFLTSALVTFYAILVLVLIFIIFAFLFRLGMAGRKAEITSATGEIIFNKIFINYLRSPFTLNDGTEITTAELYSRYYSGHGITKSEENDYKLKINQELISKISPMLDIPNIDHKLGSAMGFYLPPYNYNHNFINVQPIIADDLVSHYRNKRDK